MIVGKWQRDAQFISMYLFIFLTLHVSSTSYSSSGETNCVNTISGSCYSVSCELNYGSAHDTATDTQWQPREVVMTQFISPDDEHDVPETCTELKI